MLRIRSLMMLSLITSLIASHGIAEEPSLFRSQEYGFQINPPSFEVQADAPSVAVAMFLLPPREGLSANLNLMVQHVDGGLEKFAEITREQYQSLSWEIVSEKQLKHGDSPAVEWVVEHDIQPGTRLVHIQRCVEHNETLYILTSSCGVAQFEKLEKLFRKSMDSLQFTPQMKPAQKP